MSVQCIPPYSKRGVYRGIPIFLIFDPKHRLWVLVRLTAPVPTINVLSKNMKKVENFPMKFSIFLKTPAAEGSFDRPAVGWPVEVSLVCKHIGLPKCLRLFPPHAEQIRTP